MKRGRILGGVAILSQARIAGRQNFVTIDGGLRNEGMEKLKIIPKDSRPAVSSLIETR